MGLFSSDSPERMTPEEIKAKRIRGNSGKVERYYFHPGTQDRGEYASRNKQVEAVGNVRTMLNDGLGQSAAAPQLTAETYTNNMMFGNAAQQNMGQAVGAAKAVGSPLAANVAGQDLAQRSGQLQGGYADAQRKALTGATAQRSGEEQSLIDLYAKGIADLRRGDIDVYQAYGNAMKQQDAMNAERARSKAAADQGLLGKALGAVFGFFG